MVKIFVQDVRRSILLKVFYDLFICDSWHNRFITSEVSWAKSCRKKHNWVMNKHGRKRKVVDKVDMQKCAACGKKFDFDKEGLGCGKVVVCGEKCAEKSARSRGNSVAIHDETGKIVATNVDGTERGHLH